MAEDDDILSTMLRIKDEEEFDFPFNITHIKAVIIVSVLLRYDPFPLNGTL